MRLNLKDKAIRLTVISGFTIALGFVFHILLARTLGIAWQLDCFFIVLALFGWLCVFNTFITSLYIPTFNDIRSKDVKEGLIFADVVIKWALLISIAIALLVLFFDETIIKLLAPGFAQRNIILSKEINHYFMMALVFYGIAYSLALTLNAMHYYALVAITSLLVPVFNILALFFLVPSMGVKGIALSYLFSNLLKALILGIYFYLKSGWRPSFVFYHKELPGLINRSSRMAVNGFIWSLKDILIRNFASRLGEGAVSLFSYAEKAIDILVRSMLIPLVRVFYSRISELISLAKIEKVKNLVFKALKVNLSVSMSIAAFLLVFLPSILSLLFLESNFTAQDISTLSMLVNIMLCYFIMLAFEVYLSRVALAMQKIRLMITSSCLGIIILFMSLGAFIKTIGIYSLPLSLVCMQLTMLLMYYIFIGKFLKINLKKTLRLFSPGLWVALVFSLIGIIANTFISNAAVMSLLVLPAWVILYFLAFKIFMKEEARIIFSKNE